jgi:hypothetical protein
VGGDGMKFNSNNSSKGDGPWRWIALAVLGFAFAIKEVVELVKMFL